MLMKKSFILLAAAALTLVACNKTVTVAENEGDAISFRPLMSGVTKAADITADGLHSSGFFVTAYHKVGEAAPVEYFDNVAFTWVEASSTYTSAKKYYWPSAGTLDFYAYAPTAVDNAQLTRTDYKTFTVAPSATVAAQMDLVYANTDGKSKTGEYTSSTFGAAGVPLNFRHAESKIIVKVKNSVVNDLKFEITQVKIANVDNSAVFTYNDTPSTGDDNTDGNGSNQLKVGDWTDNTTYTSSFTTATLNTNTVSGQITSGQFLNGNGTLNTEDQNLHMILIPQTTPDATGTYASEAANAAYSGSYIALKMVIKQAGSEIVIADATADNKWAMWPVKFTWAPGKQYTYTIDLANGGYWETNQTSTDSNLDPILDNAVIKFVSVTVDNWSDADGIDVAGPTL